MVRVVASAKQLPMVMPAHCSIVTVNSSEPASGEQRPAGRLFLIPGSRQCDACSRRCCASRSHCAIFSFFAATAAQPTAVASQR